MTNYEKGANFEFRIRNIFRKFGYIAERKAASAPYDIIVMKDGKILFIIDAKKTSQRDKNYIYLKKDDVIKIMRESEKIGTTPLIVYGFYKTPAFVEFPKNVVNKKTIRLEEGLKLETFLEEFS